MSVPSTEGRAAAAPLLAADAASRTLLKPSVTEDATTKAMKARLSDSL